MKLNFLLLFVIACFQLFGQNANINLLSHVDYENLHSTELNDVWGYVDETGKEYALVGARKGVSVVDVSDPSNPVEVYWHVGTQSTWRDLKVNGDYVYVTTEAQDGLLIIDLSPLPGGSVTSTTNYFGPTGNNWSTAHNLYIDENGYGYVFGSDRGNGGVIMLDLFTDPMNPVEVGVFDNWYVHDGYVRNDTMYLAHIYDGFISIVDVTDKSNPVLLGTKETPSSFAHNVWLSQDGNYVFTTDEVTNAYLTAYDVSDPSNIVEVDRIQSSPGMGVVPHNAHVMGDFLITSYYADGVVIHDISDPSNMVETGRYDTYPGTSTSTTGCWGAYPFLPSGTLLATDIENGLFILGPDYQYGARLQGTITNSVTGNPVQGVNVTFSSDPAFDNSDFQGFYSTGVAQTGTYQVSYERYAYVPQSTSVNLTQNTVVVEDIQLVPIPDFPFTVHVEDESGNPVLNANIRLDHGINVFDALSDGLGDHEFTLYYEDNYSVIVGKWGYKTKCQNLLINDTTIEITVVLETGIYDDFTFDYGWSTTSNANAGDWERGIPIGEEVWGNYPNPNIDSPNDCGKYAFVTDNQPTTAGDVKEGTVTLISPVFDVSGMTDPHIYYERWFYCSFGYVPYNDSLEILLSNGTNIVRIDIQGSDPSIFDQWVPISRKISDYLTPTATMQLFITTSDLQGSANLTEAGFDHFIVSDGSILSSEEIVDTFKEDKIKVYPVPFNDVLTVRGDFDDDKVVITDLNGKELNLEVTGTTGSLEINTSSISSGIYLIRIGDEVLKVVKK
ncbi:MAG: choice-of-anchor B family protein [Brumimicrobium sp.]|nr:choice-of-anchor B family protein [Brumimicrobium sp.]